MGERLIGVDGFDSGEPRVLDDIDCAHAQDHLVLYDKHVRDRRSRGHGALLIWLRRCVIRRHCQCCAYL
jgi:hypothetical protein